MSIATIIGEELTGGITLVFPSSRLRDLKLRYRGAQHRDLSRLVDDALDVAAEAEQTIAAQSARIAELEALAVTDELTGLRNRRGLKHALSDALALARRHHENGVLAFLDLDGFKSINDHYGHDAGDAVLRHTASLLIAHLRASDVVTRLGGDEFAILLTRADPTVGLKRLQLLQRDLNQATVRWRNLEIALRVSMGTQIFGADDTVKTVLHDADLSMYRDKKRRQPVSMPTH
jgi:diguanylate cyclase (GGDEF)-like protein